MFSIVACGVVDMKKVFSFQVDTYTRVTCVTSVTPANNRLSLVTQSKNEGVTGVTNQEVTHQKVTQVTPGLPESVTNKPAIDAEVTPVTQVTPKNIVTRKIQAAIEARSPHQPERDEKQQNGLNHACNEMSAAQASNEQVKQDRVDDVIQAAVILAEQLKADRRAADLEELDKAFNTAMYTERTGDENSFAYALHELEALTIEYSHAEEKAVA
ncbi:MAG: hypothetical protein Kow0029_20740 [Candidatus Rifleibacteriota bacterium]